jgi:superfamily II DNA/RNA helicase
MYENVILFKVNSLSIDFIIISRIMTEKLYIQNKKGSRHYFRNFPLREEIKQLLLSKNFTKPTPVQAEAC